MRADSSPRTLLVWLVTDGGHNSAHRSEAGMQGMRGPGPKRVNRRSKRISDLLHFEVKSSNHCPKDEGTLIFVRPWDGIET